MVNNVQFKNCLLGNTQSSFYKWLVKNDPWGTLIFREHQAWHLFSAISTHETEQ